MPLRLARRDAHLDTVWAIAASRYVRQYVIGLTSRSGISRFQAYKALGYDHLVIIADQLTSKDACALERHLQQEIQKYKNTALYQKYDLGRRGGPYYPSFGGVEPGIRTYSIYMAWWE